MKIQAGTSGRLLLLVAALAMGSLSRAQAPRSGTDSAAAFKAFVQRTQQAYQQARYLGFRISYYYANADKPGQYTDSLTGEAQVDRAHSRFAIQGMETVLTDKYAIRIMDENKTIYLASARNGSAANPLGVLDSIFSHISGIRTNIRHQDQSDIMQLDFPANQQYTRIEIIVDTKTGFFRSISYRLKESSMEIRFTEYQQGKFDDRVFNDTNFFTKVAAGRFTPAPRYKDYHILLASSNL